MVSEWFDAVCKGSWFDRITQLYGGCGKCWYAIVLTFGIEAWIHLDPVIVRTPRLLRVAAFLAILLATIRVFIHGTVSGRILDAASMPAFSLKEGIRVPPPSSPGARVLSRRRPRASRRIRASSSRRRRGPGTGARSSSSRSRTPLSGPTSGASGARRGSVVLRRLRDRRQAPPRRRVRRSLRRVAPPHPDRGGRLGLRLRADSAAETRRVLAGHAPPPLRLGRAALLL